VLKACIAGLRGDRQRCRTTSTKVTIVASVGPVKAKFAGKLLLSDLNPPNSYSLSFEDRAARRDSARAARRCR